MKRKRKATPKQLKALAKGRRIRAANIRKNRRKGQGFGKRRNLKRRRSSAKLKSPRRKKRVYRRANSMSSLTGGSRDVNPQFLNVSVQQKTRNEFEAFTFALPIARTPGIGNKVTVLEILKVGFMFAIPVYIKNVATFTASSNYGNLMIGKQTIHHAFHHWSLLAAVNISAHNKTGDAGGGFALAHIEPYWYDLTDGAGHGILVATDSMTVGVDTFGLEVDVYNTCECKIMYRFKRIGMTEYVGIVQSQQGK